MSAEATIAKLAALAATLAGQVANCGRAAVRAKPLVAAADEALLRREFEALLESLPTAMEAARVLGRTEATAELLRLMAEGQSEAVLEALADTEPPAWLH